jgi:hypothetical protein
MRTLYTAASLALLASLAGCNRGQQSEPEQRVITTPQLTGTTASDRGPTVIAYAPPPRATTTPPPERTTTTTTTTTTTAAKPAETTNVQLIPVPPLGATAAATNAATTHAPAATGVNSQAASDLRAELRKLWTQHTVGTRDYLDAVLEDNGEQQAMLARLKLNHDDIGNTMATYYGKDTGDKLTSLLNKQSEIGADLARAVKGQDLTQVKDASSRWSDNRDQIADLFSSANPNFSRSNLGDMLSARENTALDEVQARQAKDWDKAAKAYDKFYDQTLKMADALADGIVKQFPEKFK